MHVALIAEIQIFIYHSYKRQTLIKIRIIRCNFSIANNKIFWILDSGF